MPQGSDTEMMKTYVTLGEADALAVWIANRTTRRGGSPGDCPSVSSVLRLALLRLLADPPIGPIWVELEDASAALRAKGKPRGSRCAS